MDVFPISSDKLSLCGNSEFGNDQAISCLADLEPVLLKLVDYPELGRARPEIRVGLRSFAYRNHVIFYRILESHIRVVRVLHGSRDLPSTLADD